MATKENFTATRVEEFKCQSGKRQTFKWDAKTPGLGVRITEAGAKSYIFEGWLHGKSFRVTIGDVRTWSVGKAQAEATGMKTLTDKGIDPRQQKAEVAAVAAAKVADEIRKDITVSDAWKAYVTARSDKWGNAHKRDHEIAIKAGGLRRGRGKRALQGELTYPGLIYPLLTIRLADITAQRVQDWLEVANQRGKTEAAKNFRLLRAFLNWCSDREEYQGIVSPNAHAKREVRELVQKVRAKKLALQKEQVKIWFESVRKISNPTAAAYLQCLLLTGARREELAQLRWTDCDFQWHSLHIKDKTMKEGRDIPMTPYVQSLIEAQPRRNEFVFSSPTSKAKYLADPLTPLQRAMRVVGLPNFSPHDLRRSFSTLSEWCEVPVGVVAQIMGHKPSATAEKHYKERPLDLLRMWHTRIEEWMLEQASIEFKHEQPSLKLVSIA